MTMAPQFSVQDDEKKNGGDALASPPSFLPKIIFFLLAAPFVFFGWLAQYAYTPMKVTGSEPAVVVIPKACTLKRIGEILGQAGVVRDDIRFSILAGLTRKASRLKAGEYSIAPGRTPVEVLDLLVAGKILYRPVTIPEGVDMARVAEILATGGWVDKEKFLDYARNGDFIRETGLDVASFEGYLFPDTYMLSVGQQDERGIIRMMVEKHRRVFSDVVQHYPGERTLSDHEIVTLASIVERETANPDERPLIARVFLNRLALNMKLQADPTVRYGLPLDSETPEGRLRRADLDRETLYNTYVIPGLPPGPIGNPGRAAIEAVLNPATESYLYFVSKNDGSHYFSKSLEEHNLAVYRFQKRKKQ